jgi:SAM-dependent methyltransferase
VSTGLVERSCPICGSDGLARIFAEADFTPDALDALAFSSRKLPEYMHYRMMACGTCDVLYASPIPTRDFLHSAYEEAAFEAPEESRFASLTYGRLLPKWVKGLPDRCGALDIGTGDGAFLHELLEQGFTDVIGVEPSAAPVALAHPRVGGLIRRSPFRGSDFEGGAFRLVTCFQTLEHVDDPLGLCREAHRLLKKPGAFFLVCHNHRALSARLLGLKSPIFDIEHLQLFSPKSARRMLEKAGFDRIEVRSVVNRYPVHYWTKLAPLPRMVKIPLLRNLKAGLVGKLPLSAPVGNMAVVGYKT